MEQTYENIKCVMIIDFELPTGVIANTSAILGVTLGKYINKTVGSNVIDASGQTHLGIISVPITMLKGDKTVLKALREKLYNSDFQDLIIADFSDVAQSCNIYEEYIKKAEHTQADDYNYLGIALYGDKKKINKLTGSMPLLR